MTGTYRGRSRHRLPRREGARCAGRTGGVPQYVPADMYPPGTESLRKRSRCLFPPSTWHGIPAKAFQVSFPAVHLPRNPCESVPGVLSCRPPATESLRKCSRCLFPPSTCHGIPAKVFQVSLPAVHLPRNPCKSVPGVTSCRPPATVFPAKAFQVSLPAVHLARRFLSLWDVGAFQQDKLAVFSMERVAVCTPAVGKCVHLSENHDVSRMV